MHPYATKIYFFDQINNLLYIWKYLKKYIVKLL